MPKVYPTAEEKRAAMRQQIERSAAAIGRQARFELIPNNMAAGPCAGCQNAAKRTYTAAKVPLMPLPECPHPDQCVGRARLVAASIF
jgi:hypothetical protein